MEKFLKKNNPKFILEIDVISREVKTSTDKITLVSLNKEIENEIERFRHLSLAGIIISISVAFMTQFVSLMDTDLGKLGVVFTVALTILYIMKTIFKRTKKIQDFISVKNRIDLRLLFIEEAEKRRNERLARMK